jgi:hypothetical protein
MEAAHQEMYDAALPDFDVRRQNVVIGSQWLNDGERVQSSTERDSDTQPVIFLGMFILCRQTTATQAEAGANEKAQANPPQHPDLHRPPSPR